MNKNSYFCILLLLILLSLPSIGQSSFSMMEYYPLPEGGTWNYRNTGDNELITARVVGTDVVNGTTVIRQDDGVGNTFSLTNDINGLRLHQFRTDFPSARIVFSPPIPMANAQANVGENLTSVGTADFIIPRAGSFPFKYTSTARIVAQEPVSVPFGEFNTIRLEFTFGLTGSINGTQIIDDSVTSIFSLAPGIGAVLDNEGELGKLELINTNTCDASYSQNTKTLRLPVVNVDTATHSATLRLVALDQDNIEFLLETAELTACKSDHTVVFDANTGKLLIPRVDIYNFGAKSGSVVNAEMVLVEGSNPFLFTLTVTEDAN